jgi:hypothetical protein
MFDSVKDKFYKIKPYFPAIAFFCGFTWDNLTLRRIDNTLDMIIFGAYLLFAGIVITLIGRKVTFKFSEYLPMVVQFFFGGLFSSFVVYYFKSASSVPSLLFMLFLLVLLVGNEFIEKKLHDVTLSATLFVVACFMYLNSILPVFLKHMNAFIFLLAVALSYGIFILVKKISRSDSLDTRPVIGTFALLILFYFLNIIPPVPLSKKEMGIYRSVSRSENVYQCSFQKPPWYNFIKKSEKEFRYAQGDTAFCFSSIFAPTKLRKKIYHHWYHKNPKTGKYSQTDKMGYRLTGGRKEGYRGYTFKKNIQPGEWKVMLKTSDRKTLGITKFEIIPRDTTDDIMIKVIEY